MIRWPMPQAPRSPPGERPQRAPRQWGPGQLFLNSGFQLGWLIKLSRMRRTSTAYLQTRRIQTKHNGCIAFCQDQTREIGVFFARNFTQRWHHLGGGTFGRMLAGGDFSGILGAKPPGGWPQAEDPIYGMGPALHSKDFWMTSQKTKVFRQTSRSKSWIARLETNHNLSKKFRVKDTSFSKLRIYEILLSTTKRKRENRESKILSRIEVFILISTQILSNWEQLTTSKCEMNLSFRLLDSEIFQPVNRVWDSFFTKGFVFISDSRFEAHQSDEL